MGGLRVACAGSVLGGVCGRVWVVCVVGFMCFYVSDAVCGVGVQWVGGSVWRGVCVVYDGVAGVWRVWGARCVLCGVVWCVCGMCVCCLMCVCVVCVWCGMCDMYGVQGESGVGGGHVRYLWSLWYPLSLCCIW